MSSINFPTSPAVNDVYTFGTKSWKWNGTSWVSIDDNITRLSVVSTTTPTGSYAEGTLWFNPAQTLQYTRYGGAWVQTVGTGVLTVSGSGVGLSGSGSFTANQSGSITITITSNATSASVANTLVSRDSNGNFWANGISAIITGSLSGSSVTATNITGSNISGSMQGAYRNLQPIAYSLSGTAIDFLEPIMYKTLSTNTTFSESNKAQGRTSIILLDRSANGYTPTFSSNVKWAAASTPGWSSYRYWVISLTCWDATYVMGAASGYTI